MGQSFMQKRSMFKESSDRRVRAEQRKIKVMRVKKRRKKRFAWLEAYIQNTHEIFWNFATKYRMSHYVTILLLCVSILP